MNEQDYYEIGLPQGAGVAANVQWKYNATIAHIQNATRLNLDQLYISFASSEHNSDVPPEYPIVSLLFSISSVTLNSDSLRRQWP